MMMMMMMMCCVVLSGGAILHPVCQLDFSPLDGKEPCMGIGQLLLLHISLINVFKKLVYLQLITAK